MYKTNIWGQRVSITKAQAEALKAINFKGKTKVWWTDKRALRTHRLLAEKGLIQVDWADRGCITYKRV